MARKRTQLAELQLTIMQVLWERGAATVGEVRDALKDARPLAHTTVGTMLTKLEERGLVAKKSGQGRAHIYSPRISRDHVNRSMVSDLATRLFGGDVSEMVCHLLEECDVSREQLSRLRTMIRQKEKEFGNGKRR